MEAKSKLSESQINLLGRLFSELDKKQSEMSNETRDIIRKIHDVLEAPSP